jgi:membrane protein implicated in regulation of membrane protease activity
MESYVVWLIMGLVLIAVELTTGTFYLLVLGIAAMAGSVTAYLGGSFSIQAVVASVIGVAGVFVVNHWFKNRKDLTKGTNNMDLGQSVIFECWTNEAARMARVKYRGASWDAQLVGDAAVRANDSLFICGREGSQLQVSPSKPV